VYHGPRGKVLPMSLRQRGWGRSRPESFGDQALDCNKAPLQAGFGTSGAARGGATVLGGFGPRASNGALGGKMRSPGTIESWPVVRRGLTGMAQEEGQRRGGEETRKGGEKKDKTVFAAGRFWTATNVSAGKQALGYMLAKLKIIRAAATGGKRKRKGPALGRSGSDTIAASTWAVSIPGGAVPLPVLREQKRRGNGDPRPEEGAPRPADVPWYPARAFRPRKNNQTSSQARLFSPGRPADPQSGAGR